MLLVPKRHITRFEELNPEEAIELFGLIKKTQEVFKCRYQLSEYLLVQKNGKDAGQSVDHIHVHAVSCPPGIDLTRMFRYRPPITHEEMRQHVNDLKPFFNK